MVIEKPWLFTLCLLAFAREDQTQLPPHGKIDLLPLRAFILYVENLGFSLERRIELLLFPEKEILCSAQRLIRGVSAQMKLKGVFHIGRLGFFQRRYFAQTRLGFLTFPYAVLTQETKAMCKGWNAYLLFACHLHTDEIFRLFCRERNVRPRIL